MQKGSKAQGEAVQARTPRVAAVLNGTRLRGAGGNTDPQFLESLI